MAETNIPSAERPSPGSPEIPRSPETGIERGPEPVSPSPERGPTPAVQPVVAPPKPLPLAPPPDTRLFVGEVENVMTEGLEETYRNLEPSLQARFKQVGEHTAVTIAGLLEETKVQGRKILELLVAWLRLIPGVNRYFLEQEAKIKADKLMALRRTEP